MGERQRPRGHFKCTFADCKATFAKMWKLEAHYCKHTGLKPFACVNCDKCYDTRSRLTRHQLSHSGGKPYLCSVSGCTDAFSTPASLKNHIVRVHQHEQRQYVCDRQNCGKAFCKKKQLRIHTCEHTNELPYECRFVGCNQKFATSKSLKSHEKKHEGYPCAQDYCPFKGKTWSEYQQHRKAEHREILPCDQCKKVFHLPFLLKRHKLWVHSGEQRVFECPREGCQKSYTTKFNLKNHILAFHEGKRDFICPFKDCGKAFAMEESLRRHSVVHNPQKTKLQKPKTRKGKKTPSKTKISDAAKLSKALQNVSLNKTV